MHAKKEVEADNVIKYYIVFMLWELMVEEVSTDNILRINLMACKLLS